ncbi:MAG: hypothetical protein ACFB5Z_02310 [Elainellaceae cyanobacterium]
MDLHEKIGQQRIKYIVDSYCLAGEEQISFFAYLDGLMQTYPLPLIELSLAETIVENWLSAPFHRGVDFLNQAHARLKYWEVQPITSSITSTQFSTITGLDPSPVFGAEQASSYSIRSS